MGSMSRRYLFRLSVLAAGLMLVICPLTLSAQQKAQYRGRKFKPPPPVSRVTVTVLRNDNDSPILNAHVIFHPIENGKDKGGMELHTNADGKCIMTIFPMGDELLLQVIADGYQTYGGIYKVEKPQMTMDIRMKLPGQQYSVYDNHDQADSGSGKGSGNGSASGSGSTGSSSGSATKNNNGSASSGPGAESKDSPDQKSSAPPKQ